MPGLLPILKAALTALGAAIGPLLLRMVLAAISKTVLEEAILQALEYAVAKYEKAAKETQTPDDDERAKRVRLIFDVWKDQLGRLQAKGQ